MRITLRQIEAFYWTAKLGSIHAAADHLNFSQPAVSARIKELEGALNLELFTRTKQAGAAHAGRPPCRGACRSEC
jgi:DNA-binding transcriptional LysR family regulator